MLMTFRWTQNRRPLINFMNPGEDVRPDMALDWDLLFGRNLLIGSPEYVVEKLEELQETIGLQELMTYMAMPYIPHSKVMRSIELFADKVLPHFQKAAAPQPIHAS